MNKLLLLYFFGNVSRNGKCRTRFDEPRWKELISDYKNRVPFSRKNIRWDRIFTRLLNE